MIIVDFSQLVLASVHTQTADTISSKHGLSMMRHLVLNHLRSIKNVITKKSGKDHAIVLACDGPNYWRRQMFPNYKSHRKASRDKSKYEYNIVFEILDTLYAEFKENFPYYVIRLYETEADDIIGTLVMTFHKFESIYIVSSDKDFKQLQRYMNVHQYDPLKKKWISEKDPISFLNEHIVRGDSGDGIPNVLSDDHCFVEGKRQTPITQKVLKEFNDKSILELATIDKWNRNRTLIDLECIPEYIQNAIKNEYEHYDMSHGRNKMYPYFVKNRLINLMPQLQEF